MARAVKVVKRVANNNEEIHAYVPDQSVDTSYVHRKIHKVSDYDLLAHCQTEGINILLKGPTGSGKTHLGAAYAANKGMLYYSLPCDVSVDPSALFGKLMPTDEIGKFEWIDGPVTQIVRNGGVLNISEVNFMPPRIASSLYPLLDSRRYVPLIGHKGEVVRAHPDLLIIADMNPNYRGTQDLNEAFKNRFPVILNWGYDGVVEKNLVKVPPLVEIAARIRSKDDIRTPVSTNMLLEFVHFTQSFGIKFAIENFSMKFGDDEQQAVKNIVDVASMEIDRSITELSHPQREMGSTEFTASDEDAEYPDWVEEGEFVGEYSTN
jgi:nitric oxide reductase NorQ protein